MNIQYNTIVYPTHVVTCDPAVYSREYMEDMARTLDEDAVEPTPREHARVLRLHNNDGTWGIKVTSHGVIIKTVAPVEVGDRVTLVRMGDDPHPIAPGAVGTVTSAEPWISNEWHIGVRWDSGRTLALIYPIDRFMVEIR
jgi:hypothetical protein